MLEGPRLCTVFYVHTAYMGYVIKHLYWLVPQSVVNNYFVQGQGQKGEQKHTEKNFVEFHNHDLY